ncbi:hypothetical protein [Mesorhizobium sp. B2-6-1]|uniref:hypothetical protein n=1 Tax=Mesorhizobium sp. B2-6-1 TaxID=2589916 RepID=UPI001AED5C36|nr:hypothetical protein [Mesorhizobium sp. B2-6-1]
MMLRACRNSAAIATHQHPSVQVAARRFGFIRPPKQVAGFRGRDRERPLPRGISLVSLHFPQLEERIMAKGAMKAGKEARKPKKDAKKPAAAPTLKAPPVKATRLKEK